MAELHAARIERMGIELHVAVDEMAMMMRAMANGIATEKLLEPETVPDHLYPTVLQAFGLGLNVMQDQKAAPR